MALVLAGIAITGSIFALKGGTLSVPNEPPMVPSAHDTARTQTPSSLSDLAGEVRCLE